MKQVHTREQLDIQRGEVERLKKQLLEIDPEFRAMIEERKREAKRRGDQMRAEHKAGMAEVERMVRVAKSKARAVSAKAEAARRNAERRLDDFAERHLVKKRTQEEAEKAVDNKLACRNPKCPDLGKNRGNMLNNVEWCFLCSHKLIPKSEVHKYNRSYWRRFNRKNKKKRKG